MKKIFTGIMSLICATGYAQTLQQTIYFDFGSGVTNRGVLTPTDQADAFGHYWNNINANDGNYIKNGSEFSAIVDGDNAATSVGIKFNSRFTTNGMSGGGGWLLEDGDSRLGDLAVLTAVEDYMFLESNENNSNFTISGLNPDNAYLFHIFASRNATQKRVSAFTASGYNISKGELQAAGTGIGTKKDGTVCNQNSDNILDLGYVFPDEEGKIVFTVSRSTGDYIPINAMKMEVYAGVAKPELFTFKSVKIVGSAVEGGEVELSKVIESQKSIDKYETFVKLSAGSYSFSAVGLDDQSLSLGTGEDGQYAVDGAAFEQAEEQVVRVTLDPDGQKVTLLPITGLYVSGPLSAAGWSTSGEEIKYKANGVWEETLEFTKEGSVSDPSRIVLLINRSWDYQLKSVAGGRLQIGLAQQGYTVNDIRLKKGKYVISVDLRNYSYLISPVDGIDPERITVIGSSVANGQGATGNEGYAYMLGEMLGDRYDNSLSDSRFYTSGVAVNGNNTINVLNRFDDFINNHGSYGILGLGLGNEGLHEAADKDATYAQWKNNIQKLVVQMQAEGKKPVVTNNYPRGDYNATDYAYAKKMNLEMHEWNIPTVNFLGALDNCKDNGQWADGYQVSGDIYHPTTEGHVEFMHAFVPSLFDALAQGKAQPARQSVGDGLMLTSKKQLVVVPEDQAHSFTLAVNLKASAVSSPVSFDFGNDVVRKISLSSDEADGQWHTYVFTYYYAAGKIFTYIDGQLASSEDAEGLELKQIVFAGNGVEVSQLFFYRSGMNADEVSALQSGKMLKSSLEIYSPLSDGATDNLAQSLNEVKVVDVATPVKTIDMTEDKSDERLFNIMGQRVARGYRGLVISRGVKTLTY